ncbi:hypothetical protein [Amycolatopsis rifamycinica]|uniref:Uncharacterized protein n=1 Tax=Amycolatopsis rifamycinica TaxID=287986 RepID=A0A066UE12_9PSEU|nr:hypothetical protein [Amycolatopsis rifamycinica]KDN22394.1 hypothetical protein DV20_10825 [Amycolatopsis rifamycinica]
MTATLAPGAVTGDFTGGTTASLSNTDGTGASWAAPGKSGGGATLTATEPVHPDDGSVVG